MPYRRLPNTDQARVRALKAAVEKGDVYNVRDLAISLKTLFEARNFLQRFEAAQIYYTQCYENQSRASRKHQANVKTARLYISHFIQVLNLAVLRDEIKAVHKKLYDLPDANVVPDLLSEASLVEWGKKIIEGEQRRTGQGGIPIYNPTIARVKVHYDIFLDSYERQKNYQALTNRSLDELSSMRERADELILDIWNQVEAKYQDVTPNEDRLDKCRDYGLDILLPFQRESKRRKLVIMLIDTHSHLFLEEFAEDLPQVMERARNAGVSSIFMPNIDSTTIDALLSVCAKYPDLCYPMIGLHPTSVNETYEQELAIVRERLSAPNYFVAIGEIGLDLYWDRTFLKEQLLVFERQIEWALEYELPVVIHTREAFDYIYKVMEPYKKTALRGIFHSFTGTPEEAARLLEFDGFMLGINGVVTFKKSTLPETLLTVPLERIVLETDSPYLTPVPNRGKRNESANVKDTLAKVAEIYQKSLEYVAQVTSENALKVFGFRK